MLVKVIKEGDVLKIGDLRVTLTDVLSGGGGLLEVVDPSGNVESVEISVDAGCELAPDVIVSVSPKKAFSLDYLRLCVDAPREVNIRSIA